MPLYCVHRYYYIDTVVYEWETLFVLVQIEKEYYTWRSDTFLRGTGNDNERRTRAPTSYARGRPQRLAKNICAHALPCE